MNFSVIKPTTYTNFTNLFCHETLHVSDSSSVHHQEFIHCILSNGVCHTGLWTAVEQKHMLLLLYVCPRRTTRLPLDGISWKVTFEDFSKLYQENSIFFKYDNNSDYYTRRPMWSMVVSRRIILRMRYISDKIVVKIKTHILCSLIFFPNILPLMGQCEKNMVEPDRPQRSI